MKFIKNFIYIVLISFSIYSQKLVVISDSWPPYFDITIESKGLAVEILEAALENKNYVFEYKEVPGIRAEGGVDRNNYDVLLNVWKSKEREKKFLFSDSYITNKLVFYKLKCDNFEFKNFDSLKGKKIGTRRGYYYDENLMNSEDFYLIPVNSSIQNLQKLISGRIDIFIEDKAVIENIFYNEVFEDKSFITFFEKPIFEKELYLIVNPKMKNG
jgi:polar amino acid transport system substrate-binding protein